MGRKSYHFRHSVNANSDQKIMRLRQLGGLKAVGAFWTLLEIYCSTIIEDDNENLEQKINARHVANTFGVRADSCKTLIELMVDCELIEALFVKSDVSYIQLSIPNMLKYFGRYQKTETMKCPKEKKRKEKKIKNKKEKKPDHFEGGGPNSNKELIECINDLDFEVVDSVEKYGVENKTEFKKGMRVDKNVFGIGLY